jgi:hypothetical protein
MAVEVVAEVVVEVVVKVVVLVSHRILDIFDISVN